MVLNLEGNFVQSFSESRNPFFSTLTHWQVIYYLPVCLVLQNSKNLEAWIILSCSDCEERKWGSFKSNHCSFTFNNFFSIFKLFYCCSITVVCIFSPPLYSTPAKHTSFSCFHPLPWFCSCFLYCRGEGFSGTTIKDFQDILLENIRMMKYIYMDKN